MTERLTLEHLQTHRTALFAHCDMSPRGSFVNIYKVVGLERITVHRTHMRGENPRLSYFVDEKPCRDAQAAVDLYNGDITPEQAMPAEEDEKPPADKPKPRFSIHQQIEEVKYELMQRDNVYPRLVRKGTLRQGEADLHTARMEAALRSLEWLRDNEPHIKQRLSY
ncbi:MAG: hypothetical protein AB7S70_10135 [Hyphomicrobium sp.]